MRHALLIGLMLGGIAAWTHAAAAQGPQTLPVPEEDARQQVRTQVEKLFPVAAAKDAPQKQALAAKLLQVGKNTKGDAVAQFVLYNMARELAMAGEDAAAALDAVAQLDTTFQIDRLQLQARTLYEAIGWKLSAAQELAVANQTLDLIDASIAANRLELADPLAKRLSQKSRQLRDIELRKRILSQQKRVVALSKQWANLKPAVDKLQVAPNDGDANLQYGMYLCLAVGDWAKGLPHLAKGSDVALKELSQRDLAGPQQADQQQKPADDWFQMAETQLNFEPCKQRAGHWYQIAHGKLDGIGRLTVERRLEELGLTAQVKDLHREATEASPVTAPASVVPTEDASDPAKAHQRQASIVPWTTGKPPLALLRSDQGFCFLGGIQGVFNGATDAAHLALQRDGRWYVDGKSKEPIAVGAMVVPSTYRQLFEDEVLTFVCRGGEGPIKMIHAKDGFGFLSTISGNFAGGGEEARVYIDDKDGFWYLELRTQQPLLAQACAMRLKTPGKFDAKVTEHHWKNGEEPVRMLEADKGFCFLSAVGGGLNTPKDGVGIVRRENVWYLSGTSNRFVVAKAMSILVPDWSGYVDKN